MGSRPKVAVIGLGMGRGHAKAAAENRKADLVALCDIDAEKLERYCAELAVDDGYINYKRMLREQDLDIVSVSLPNHLHKPVTVAALEAGANVLCEKPMAMNTREAERMAEVARKKRKKLMINFSYRFTGEAKALKKVVDAGTVGDIYYGRTGWRRTRGIPKFGGWFAQKKLSGGGPLIDLGVHRIDLAMWLMGHPTPVTISAMTYDKLGSAIAKRAGKPFDVEDLAAAMIRFDNGATLLVEVSWALNTERREEMFTYLYGTKAGICHRNVGQGYDFEACLFGEWDGTYVTSRIKRIPKRENSMDHFIDVIVDGVPPATTPEDGVNVMRVLDGIYKSAKLGKEIRIPQKKGKR
jgi:predicted dehydrogenase